MLALARKIIEIGGAIVIARGIVHPLAIVVRRQQAALAVVDRHELRAGIGIAVLRIAHEVRVRPRLIVIIAIAAVDRLGIAPVTAAGLPHPRADIAIVIGVVRRGIADRLGHALRTVEIGIGVRPVGEPGDAHGMLHGQGLDRRGGAMAVAAPGCSGTAAGRAGRALAASAEAVASGVPALLQAARLSASALAVAIMIVVRMGRMAVHPVSLNRAGLFGSG
jgi:hypothetical protein